VDRAHGIIFAVKMLGRTSPNTHGVRGAEGTRYTSEAFRTLLEFAVDGRFNCNRGHPPRSRPNEERDPEVRSAWLENFRITESGVYGDLHFLDPTEPLAAKMMTAAEENPGAYALSINAVGQGEVEDGRYVVHRITEVRSIDIVLEGGTNRSLFEGKAVLVPIAEVLREKVMPALQAGRRKRLARLCESMPASLLMEADDGNGKDHLDHLYDAMRSAKAAGHDDVAKGCHKLMHPDMHDLDEEESEQSKEKEESEEDGEERERTEMEGMGEEGPGEGGAHNEGPDGKGGPATAWESRRRRKRQVAGTVRLTESQAQKVCRTAGVECTADLMEAIKGASFEQAMAVIALAKKAQAPSRTSAPRSVSPQRRDEMLPAATDSRGWMARLLG
jgi:hypothetical protein